MSTQRTEPDRHYPRPNSPDLMTPRDIALLNELHELRVAVDRLTETVQQQVRRVGNGINALVEQGDWR